MPKPNQQKKPRDDREYRLIVPLDDEDRETLHRLVRAEKLSIADTVRRAIRAQARLVAVEHERAAS